MPISLRPAGKPKIKSKNKPGKIYLGGSKPVVSVSKAQQTMQFTSEPEPDIIVDTEKFKPHIITPDSMKGFINGIYFARVMLFDIIFMARDKYSHKQIENKNRELVEHLDAEIDRLREKLGLVSPEENTDHIVTHTIDSALESIEKQKRNPFGA